MTDIILKFTLQNHHMKQLYALSLAIAINAALIAQTSSQTFVYTGTAQLFTVPPCVDSLDFFVNGAEGSMDGGNLGLPGKGGEVSGRLNVTPGEVLYLFVGGAGAAPVGGFNGGGNGGTSTNGPAGGGGGGASDIRQNGPSINNRVAVAGGGGGCGGYNGVGGGSGGNLVAGMGTTGAGIGGFPGTQTLGGAGGAGAGACGVAGTTGVLATGGAGGNVTCGNGFGGGGAGGGGYYGGGGGGGAASLFCCPDWSGGGGGGSSYTAASASGVVHAGGSWGGNGEITLMWIPCPTSVSENDLQRTIHVYPNPVTNTITISIPGISGTMNVTLTDVSGKEILKAELNSRIFKMDASFLQQGFYFLVFEDENGQVVRKIIKQ